MNKLFTTIIVFLISLGVQAQFYIYLSNGEVLQADSISLVAPTSYDSTKPIVGALNGVFSISATSQVNFSKGNLQYQASTNTWKFADAQYDAIGLKNINISSTYDGWIDLFGWATSGWNSGAIAYQPYSSSVSDADYHIGGGTMNDMSGEYVNADWGMYNAISNGGNIPGKWRTLTYSEWKYLIELRPKASQLRAKATIGNIPGYILLPDDWQLPNEVSFSLTPYDWDFSRNKYSLEQWQIMEIAGAVFLPCTGSRHGTIEVGGTSSGGHYWSATPADESNAWNVGFYYDYMGINKSSLRHNGFSVRLVHDIK